MEDLFFSYNWNNKLDCKAFTTIRLFNPGKHVVGVKYRVMLKRTENKGVGVIRSVKPFLLEQLNPYISYLDTGYPVEECRNIILKMYPKIDFTTKKLALILIVKEN
jgi:hypothetical protein